MHSKYKNETILQPEKSNKIYKYESLGLKVEGTKEQILALYSTIKYEESLPTYLRDILIDIESDFPAETGIE